MSYSCLIWFFLFQLFFVKGLEIWTEYCIFHRHASHQSTDCCNCSIYLLGVEKNPLIRQRWSAPKYDRYEEIVWIFEFLFHICDTHDAFLDFSGMVFSPTSRIFSQSSNREFCSPQVQQEKVLVATGSLSRFFTAFIEVKEDEQCKTSTESGFENDRWPRSGSRLTDFAWLVSET